MKDRLQISRPAWRQTCPARRGAFVRRVPRQRGLALVAVLWMVAALLLTASGIVLAVRGEVRAVSAAREMAQAGALGDAGIVLAARQLVDGDRQEARLRQFDVDFEGAAIAVRVIPLTGLINLNSAAEPLLAELFAVGGGVDRSMATSLAQRVLDWRDADAQPRPAGAEDPAYIAAGSPFRTRGGPFVVPEDLMQVLGVDFDLFARLRPLVTVHARGDGRVDPLAAPLPVLRVLAGGNEELAASYAGARDASGALADSTRFPAAFVSRGQQPARFLVEAAVPLSNGARLVTRKALDVTATQDGMAWVALWSDRVVEPAQGQ